MSTYQGTAAFDGCSFSECHADNDVRLHSHTTPQAPAWQREAMQIPLLRDYGARMHTLNLRSKGALMRSEGSPLPVLYAASAFCRASWMARICGKAR